MKQIERDLIEAANEAVASLRDYADELRMKSCEFLAETMDDRANELEKAVAVFIA